MTDLPLAERSVELVRAWIDPARTADRRSDPAAERLAHLLQDPAGLDFTVGFVDRVVRPEDSRVAARNLRHLARRTPKFLPYRQRLLLKLGATFSLLMPGFVVSQARRTLRRLVGHLVIDARPAQLGRAIKKLRKRGDRLNLNLLGEAVLGEREATRRRDRTVTLLERDDVDYVSVKVSAVASQLSMWAFDETVERVAERLQPLYEKAASQRLVHQPRHGGVPRPRPHHRGVHQGARHVPRPRGRHRAAGLPARLPRGHAAAPDVGIRAALARVARPSRCASSRAPTWPWNGSTPRSTAGRWPPGAPSRRPTPTTSASSTGRSRPSASTPCASASPVRTSSTSRTPGCSPRNGRSATASSSRCCSGWTPAPWTRSVATSASSCSTRRSFIRRSSTSPSPIWCAASRRTRAARTSCRRPSTSPRRRTRSSARPGGSSTPSRRSTSRCPSRSGPRTAPPSTSPCTPTGS